MTLQARNSTRLLGFIEDDYYNSYSPWQHFYKIWAHMAAPHQCSSQVQWGGTYHMFLCSSAPDKVQLQILENTTIKLGECLRKLIGTFSVYI